jgi:hypothetical protein
MPDGREVGNKAAAEGISGGEFARWIKITTPRDRPDVIRVLETAAAILRNEIEKAASQNDRAVRTARKSDRKDGSNGRPRTIRWCLGKVNRDHPRRRRL